MFAQIARGAVRLIWDSIWIEETTIEIHPFGVTRSGIRARPGALVSQPVTQRPAIVHRTGDRPADVTWTAILGPWRGRACTAAAIAAQVRSGRSSATAGGRRITGPDHRP